MSAASSPVGAKSGGSDKKGIGKGIGKGKRGGKAGSTAAERKCGSYVAKLLKQECPGVGVSSRALAVICSLVELHEQKLTQQAIRACKVSKKNTLGEEHVKGGAIAVLPLQLAQSQNAKAAKLLADVDKLAKASKASKSAKGAKASADAEATADKDDGDAQ